MEVKEALEMLSDSEKVLDIDSVVKLIEKLQAQTLVLCDVRDCLDVESDREDVLLGRLSEVCEQSKMSVLLGEELDVYRVQMRNKVLGRAEIVLLSFNKEEYVSQLEMMDDSQLLTEFERLGVLLNEKMAVDPVTAPVVESRSPGLARLAEFKV